MTRYDKRILTFVITVAVLTFLFLAPWCFGAWDNTLPKDTTTFDDAMGYIRANWNAMEVIWGVDLGDASPMFNIKSGDVTGNGTTDDTAALNTTLALVADGDTVFFPPGTYLCDNLDTLSDLDGVTFIGYGAVLKSPDDETAGAGLTFSACTDIVIEGFEFNRRNSYISGHYMNGILFTNCTDCLVKSCVFNECWAGVITSGTANNKIQVEHCTMAGRLDYSAGNNTNKLLCGRMVSLSATADNDCGISFCRTYQAGIFIGTADTRTTIIGNVSRASNDSPIYSQGTRATITGNIVINPGKDGIKAINTSEHALIANNQVYGAGINKADGGIGINVIGNNSSITGNNIEMIADASVTATTQAGIAFEGAGHSVIGNYIKGISGQTHSGISAHNRTLALSNTIISGNNINGGANGIGCSNITNTNALTNILIEGNIITSMSTQGIVSAGDAVVDVTDVTIRENIIKTPTGNGISLSYHQRPHVINNRVYGTATRSFRLDYCHNLIFEGNKQDGAASTSRVAMTSTDFFVETFTDTDATPAVGAGTLFKTFTNTLSITDFDEGTAGQILTVISKAAITFDVTSTDLKGGTTDIVTASGDVTQWISEDGTTWRLITWMDVSQNNASNGTGLYGQ